MKRSSVALLLALSSLSAVACDNKSVVEPGQLYSLTITPNPKDVIATGTAQFTLVAKDIYGSVIAVTPTWAVSSGGGTINSTGLFTAGTTVGTFPETVKATVGSGVATATVNVKLGALASLTLTPNPVTLGTGGTQQYTVVGKDSLGNVVAATPVYAVVAGGGTISSTGLFTAGTTSGTFANTVKATSGSISSTATVTVLPGALASLTLTPTNPSLVNGTTQQFTVAGKDANGNIVAITPVFSVVNGGGTVNSSSGLFTAGATVGTYANTLVATAGGLTTSTSVTVTAGPLASITVTPATQTLAQGATQQYVATGRDAAGNTVAITPVWTVVNGGGTINSTGLFTAGSTAGTFANTVQATSGTISGTATVIVQPAITALATITVTPNPANVAPNGTQQFTAVGRDGAGNVVVITPVWSATAGGTINPSTGLFTAGAVTGTFTNAVRATSGIVSGTATVVVGGAPPPPAPLIDLGAAAPNGIMAGTAVTCVNLGTINADVSISPGNTLTGFGPCVITGTRHLNDASAVAAQLALTSAYNQLAGLPCPPANFIVANLGGTTKTAGVYCSASSIGITGTLTLDGGGDPNANFVFQAGSTLTTAGSIVLINGAQARNVYFQVGSSATLGVGSAIQGNILALSSITLVDNATLTGRALARNGGVSLGTGNVIILP